MAKDDYYVIVYKILAYLYMQLKNGENTNPDFIKNDGFLFKINERYWNNKIVHLLKVISALKAQNNGFGAFLFCANTKTDCLQSCRGNIEKFHM